jgi:hypothetical protein
MATEKDNFTGLVTDLDSDKSELEKDPDLDRSLVANTKIKPSNYNTNTKIKPSNYNTNTSTSKVAPLVVEPLVKIDDELFRKVLFFTLFIDVQKFDFSDKTKKIDDIDLHVINNNPVLYTNANNKNYLKITGFVETIIVFLDYLKYIKFYNYYKYSFMTPNNEDSDNYDSANNIFTFSTPSWGYFYFGIPGTTTRASLGMYDITECKSQLCYDEILSIYKGEKDKLYITQKEINTLSNYVALLEKLIHEEIVVTITDGELFANRTKIGFKRNCINSAYKKIKNTLASSATIGPEENPNKVFYDTIFSVFRNPLINARYGLEIYDSELCGGRNNKTRKRHRNKASHKKMRKSHNIRKRKATGKKRK